MEKTQMKPALDDGVKYMLYALILCLVGNAAYSVNLPDMIEGRGFLARLLLVVPEQIWIVGATLLQVIFLVKVRARTSYIMPGMGGLWMALIALVAVGGCLGFSGDEKSIWNVLQMIAEIATIVMMIIIGLRLRASDEKPLAILGSVMLWVPVLCLLASLVLFAMLPDDFGSINQKTTDLGQFIRVEESYSDSTIIYAVIFVIISVLGDGIVYGAMASVISMPEGERKIPTETIAAERNESTAVRQASGYDTNQNAESESNYMESGAYASTADDMPTPDDHGDDEHKRRRGKIVIFGAVALAIVAGITAVKLYAGGSSPYKDYFAKVDVPEKQLSEVLAAGDEYMMDGWAYRKTKNGDSDTIIIYNYHCSLKFDAGNQDFPAYGVPFKFTYCTSDEGHCNGVGFAKPDSISIYKPSVAYFSEPEGLDVMRSMNPLFMDDNDGCAYGLCYFPVVDNTLMLKAGVNNWNHIVASFSEFDDGERVFPLEEGDEVILDLYESSIYHKILEETPRMTYKADNGLVIEMQMIRPAENVSSDFKAFVIGSVEGVERGRSFMTTINSDGEFEINGKWNGFGSTDDYIGVVKWTKDKLTVNNHGDKTELYLSGGPASQVEEDDSDRKSANIENEDLPDGVFAECVLGDGRTYTLKGNGKVLYDGEIRGDANWSIEDEAIVIFTGEGTSFITVLGEYAYEGYYKNGQCWVEEWVGYGENGGLEDVGYIPTPDKGERIKIIKISNKTSQGTNNITNAAETSTDTGIQNSNGVIGHTYENARIGIQWTFVNEHNGLARFDYDGQVKEFTWGYGENGHILIYGKYKDVDAGVEIIDNGKKLNVLDFSDGSEFVMLRID